MHDERTPFCASCEFALLVDIELEPREGGSEDQWARSGSSATGDGASGGCESAPGGSARLAFLLQPEQSCERQWSSVLGDADEGVALRH